MRMPPQSVLVREIRSDINQPANQTTQPGSEPTQIGLTENGPQEDTIVTTPRTRQQLLDGSSVTNERRMIDMGTNTLDIEVIPHRDGSRTPTMDANAQASLPIVEVMLPSGRGDQLAIPQMNLSISRYEPNSLRDSHVRYLSMRAREISIMQQLDGPASLPRRDRTGRRIQEDSSLVGQGYSQGGTYVQGASIPRRMEYPGESSDDDNVNRRPYRDQRPLEKGRHPNQSGRPPDQRGYPDRGPPRRGYPNRN